MLPKERVLRAVNHEEPDRVPVDFWAEPRTLQKLAAFLGLEGGAFAALDGDERLEPAQRALEPFLSHFGSDIREVSPRYCGPPLPEFADGSRTGIFGERAMFVETEHDSYWHVVSYPLAAARRPEDIWQHRWPDPDWFDYECVVAQCRAYSEYAIVSGSYSVWNFSFFTRGMDRILVDLVSAPEIADAVIEAHTRFALGYYERLLQTAKGLIDIVRTYDDYGMQQGLMMSPALWRRFIKPRLAELVELVHSYGAKFMLHSCGSVVEVIADLIEIGVDILDPVQTRARGMCPEDLKESFGQYLCFHGGLDTQEVLPHGRPEEVEKEVIRLVKVFGRGGGYIFNSSQALLPDIPPENIEAAYRAAREYGKYPLDP